MEADTGATILIVDDEPGVRMVLERMLQRLGYEVLSEVNGHDALATLAHGPAIQLIVLDLGLPDMTGDQVLDQLSERGSQIPVLLSSGRSAEELADRLYADNAVAGVLRKPFRLPELKQAVAACIGDNVPA
ncbi:MAG: response regulator [Acidobacteriota bacterium]